MTSRRVAITGLGVVSALGCDVKAFWTSLLAGRCAIGPVESFDSSPYRTHIGAEIENPPQRAAFSYARAAAQQALLDAGLKLSERDLGRAGVVIGTTSGELACAERAMDRRLSGAAPAAEESFCSPASISARLAGEYGFKGPNAALTTACAAGNFALAYAFDKIASGRAGVMLAGGVDVFSRITFSGFNRLLALAPERCAPFSLGRRGLVTGEGAAVLVLEDYERAAAAGRRIYAEVAGYGLSCDAAHVTSPNVDGVCRALRECLAHAAIAPEQVDYINAHGTGTPANDRTETAAIKKVFGARRVPVSSIKSMLGHAMGAASALEAVACALTVDSGMLPPTINFTPGDPDCDLDCVAGAARKADPGVVLSDAFAFGGSNAVVAFVKPGAAKPRDDAARSRVVVTGLGIAEREGALEAAAELLPDRDLSFLDEPSAYCAAAAARALADARIADGFEEGGIIADTTGEFESLFRFYKDLAQEGPDGVEPRHFPNTLANAAASRTAILFGLKAVNESFGGCFSGGENAVAAAYDWLARRGTGFIVAGGIDRGAGLLVLEPYDRAKARGARIYAEITGYEESFEPQKLPKESSGCFCLVSALQKLKGDQAYVGRGRWGGRIKFSLIKSA